MTDVDFTWVKQQLTNAGVRQGTGDAVLALLETWDKLEVPSHLHEDVAEVFGKLSQGHALIKNPGDELWVQAEPGGRLAVGDTVRIHFNAFPDEAGRMHNGRRGKVVGIRSGKVYVQSTDGLTPFIDGTGYDFRMLDYLVKGIRL